MAIPLRVLILEDQPADAELVVHELRRQGFAPDVRCAETREAFVQALDWTPEVILCDYYMPQLEATEVLAILNERGVDIPFIVVSGSIGEDLATSIVKAGADDYLLKDRLARLGSSIEHAMREKKLRADKRRIEEDLRQSETRFRSAFENAPVGMLITGVDGVFLMANRSISEMLGYSQEEFEEMNFQAITHPDDLDRSGQAIRRVLSGEEDYLSIEKRYLHKNGQVIWGHVTAFLLREPDGTPLYFITHIMDISERKRNVERLEKLNRMYAVLTQVNETIVRAEARKKLLLDVCRIIVEQGLVRMAWIGLVDEVSHRVEPAAWHGHEDGYLDGLVVSVLDDSEGRGPTGTAIREARHVINQDTADNTAMTPWRQKAIERGYLSSAAFPLILHGKAIGALNVYAPLPGFFEEDMVSLFDELAGDLSFALDAIGREEALQNSERRYRLLFERNQAAVFRAAGQGTILDCNHAFLKMLGLPSTEASKGRNLGDFFVHPQIRDHVAEALLQDGALTNQEVEILGDDGLFRTLLVSATLIRDLAANTSLVEGTAVDITEMRQGERERRLLSTAVEQGHEAVMVTDTQGHILYVNRAFEALSGFTRGELYHKNPRVLRSGSHDQAFYADLWGTLLKGHVWSGRIVNRGKTGGLYTVHSIISPIRDEKGVLTTFVAAQRDVSEELRMQESLERARKLETIGMITGGVAHEVRNPLFALSTVAAALDRKLGGQEDCKVFLTHINDQVRRLSQLMNDLLVLGRPIEPAEFLPCQAHEVIREAFAHAHGGDPGLRDRLVMEAPEEPLVLLGDPGKLVQVFVNLLQNALHLSVSDEPVTVKIWPSGQSVQVAVVDHGPGIPRDFLPRIFEPFTSRRKGGTGLGLAIVAQIVSAHGGSVRAENNTPGPGATFTVTLPRHHPA